MKNENKIVTIHQPSYFPWLGLLHKINKADCYIYMDEVQLSDSSFQHRNVFLTNSGIKKFLVVNISKKDYKKKKISELNLSNTNWNKEHLVLLTEYYKKHPFFLEIFPYLEKFFNQPYSNLNEVLYHSMKLTFKLLKIETELIKMSNLNYDNSKTRGDLVIELILRTEFNKYLSGKGAKEYMDMDEFKKNEISVEFQEFNHPRYNQRGVSDFIPGLSVLDLLFNEGIEKSREIFHSI